ncbi:DoxX family protein [Candidatus Gracilibacteria bacterium]|nr:DoxX family protein [Candidatus Gracilibacteria bacterium]MCF7819326.1 DoxX family protein [Candidatus Gracilibacteria bacterium]
MKEKSCCCCHNPALALFLVRIGVGLLFLLPGIDKWLGGVENFAGMLEGMVGLTGTAGLVAAWLVVLFEVLGGLFILLGKIVPKPLYKISVLGLFVISVVALLGVHLPAATDQWAGTNIVQLFFQVLATLGLVALWVTYPLCPLGITGCKSAEKCDTKK